MPRSLKSFDELSFELLAANTIGDPNVSLPFSASRMRAASPDPANPLVQPTTLPRAPLAYTDGWRHGGINE
jgi:hypothetical protein